MKMPILVALASLMALPAAAQPAADGWRYSREGWICSGFGYSPADPRSMDCRVVARHYEWYIPSSPAAIQSLSGYCRHRSILSDAFPECLHDWRKRREACGQPPAADASPRSLERRRSFCAALEME